MKIESGRVSVLVFALVAVSMSETDRAIAAQKPPKPPTPSLGTYASLPASARLLFLSNRDTGVNSRRYEIYTMDLSGGSITQISTTSAHHFIMGLDNSRRYLVDSRADTDTDLPTGLGDEDRRSVWVVDLKTKRGMQLTNPANNAEGKSFSPDGEWIVFMMTKAGENCPDIYKIKRDGTGLVQLTSTPDALEGDACWSRDGTKIAFIYMDAETPRWVIKQMGSDGNNVATVYDGGEGVEIDGAFAAGNYDPTWSPDDQWIVYQRPVYYSVDKPENFGAGIWHIFKVRTDGSSNAVDLSAPSGHVNQADYFPSFSPDGQTIAFSSNYESPDGATGNYMAVFAMDPDGNSLKQLIFPPLQGKMAVWIP